MNDNSAIFSFTRFGEKILKLKKIKQAGAELGQAQPQLGFGENA